MEPLKIAFVGAGLIGSGLALNAITHGIPVVLQDIKPVDFCQSRIDAGLKLFLDHHIITESEAAAAAKRVTLTASLEEAVTGASMVQESGPDNLALKRALTAEIEKYAPDDAIIATSTSSLSITQVYAQAKRPERCMGGHPYNPAHLIPLVEITKGQQTADACIEKAKNIYARMGKIPVVLNKETIGFIANRYQSAIHREAVDLVENGVCSVEDADKALVYSIGLRWSVLGQFLTMHLGVSPEGIGCFNEKYHIDVTKPDGRLSHMPTWTTFPADWCKHAEAGLEKAIANRPPEMGNDIPAIEKWRDAMLIGTLRLHGLL